MHIRQVPHCCRQHTPPGRWVYAHLCECVCTQTRIRHAAHNTGAAYRALLCRNVCAHTTYVLTQTRTPEHSCTAYMHDHTYCTYAYMCMHTIPLMQSCTMHARTHALTHRAHRMCRHTHRSPHSTQVYAYMLTPQHGHAHAQHVYSVQSPQGRQCPLMWACTARTLPV